MSRLPGSPLSISVNDTEYPSAPLYRPVPLAIISLIGATGGVGLPTSKHVADFRVFKWKRFPAQLISRLLGGIRSQSSSNPAVIDRPLTSILLPPPVKRPVAVVQTSGEGLEVNTIGTLEPLLVNVAEANVTVMVPANGPTAVTGTDTVCELEVAINVFEFEITVLGAEEDSIVNV